MPKPNAPATPEELDPLPPLDGDETEAEVAPAEELADDGEQNLLDDATAEDDPIEDEDFGADESPAVGDDAEGPDGELDEVPAPGDTGSFIDGDDPAPPAPHDDEDLDDDQPPLLADGGEEGLDEEGEELRAEDLPPLDADEHEEQADEGFFERIDAQDGGTWDEQPWELAFAHTPLDRVAGLAVVDGGAFVFAGRLTFLSDRGRLREPGAKGLVGNVARLSSGDGTVDAVMTDGRVLRSSDGGETFLAHDAAVGEAAGTDVPLSDGRVASAAKDDATGRWLVTCAGKIVADVSNDVDADGDESRVLCMRAGGELVWVATPSGVAVYRTGAQRGSRPASS